MPVLVTALHVMIVRDLGEGRVPSIGRALRSAAPRFPHAVAGVVIYTLLAFGGMILLVVPGLWVMVAGCFVAQTAVIEGRGPFAAFRRSTGLVEERWWRTAGTLALGWVLLTAVAFPVGLAVDAVDSGVIYVVLYTLVEVVTLSLTALSARSCTSRCAPGRSIRSATAPLRCICRPRQQLSHLPIREPDRRLGRHEQRRRLALRGPRLARLPMRIVDPRERPGAGVGVDRVELPMALHAAPWTGRALERQVGPGSGETERMGEVLVRLLLPAGAPHRLERVGEQTKVFACGGRKEMSDAVDHLEAPCRRRMLREAEQRDHAVNVDEQDGSCGIFDHRDSFARRPDRRRRRSAIRLALRRTIRSAQLSGPVPCPYPGDELKRPLRTADDDGEEPAPAAGRGSLIS
jgi:hypothetical protein